MMSQKETAIQSEGDKSGFFINVNHLPDRYCQPRQSSSLLQMLLMNYIQSRGQLLLVLRLLPSLTLMV
jgi:hypothetical protein